jgi:hypothetical protein
MTSVHGSILKMDSTKKIVNKLGGESRGSAEWATSIGNEYGQALICVFTDSESEAALKPMADGLVRRYKEHGQDPPKVLYVDRWCCAKRPPGGDVEEEDCEQPDVPETYYHRLFSGWPTMHVRLDIWHFMRRIAVCCFHTAHPMYATFMTCLSEQMFAWDQDDYERLVKAYPCGVTRTLMLTHVRRYPRSAEDMEKNVSDLLELFSHATDFKGHPLINMSRVQGYWEKEKHHLRCLQDPPGVSLYSVTKTVRINGIDLPVYKSSRGSVSLENYHLHLCRFIPGTQTSIWACQAYLLDGLVQWNNKRLAAAVKLRTVQAHDARFHDPAEEEKFRKMERELYDYPVTAQSTPRPNKYTGERYGVDYLLQQTGGQDQDLSSAECEQWLAQDENAVLAAMARGERPPPFEDDIDLDAMAAEADAAEKESGIPGNVVFSQEEPKEDEVSSEEVEEEPCLTLSSSANCYGSTREGWPNLLALADAVAIAGKDSSYISVFLASSSQFNSMLCCTYSMASLLNAI